MVSLFLRLTSCLLFTSYEFDTDRPLHQIGSITFEVLQESESHSHCAFIFKIRDTGIGIEKDILPTLFVPFQQADTSTAREFDGTGLGLAISRNVFSYLVQTQIVSI